MKKANNGGGFNEFYFTKSDGTTVAPKIAYSEKFEPWNWVITTGNYVDDMRSQVKDTSQAMNIVIRNIAMAICNNMGANAYDYNTCVTVL